MDRKTKYESDDEATSESETNSDNEIKYESDPCGTFKSRRIKNKLCRIQRTNTEHYGRWSWGTEEAKNKAHVVILPKLQEDLQNIYLEHLIWIRHL
jgi:hypothetical protein